MPDTPNRPLLAAALLLALAGCGTPPPSPTMGGRPSGGQPPDGRPPETREDRWSRPPGTPPTRQEIESRRAKLAAPIVPEVRLGPDDGHSQNETSIDADGSTVVAGWNHFVSDRKLAIGMGRSGDRGETWTWEVWQDDHAFMTDPAVASGGDGRWYFAYLGLSKFSDQSSLKTAEVWVRRSRDDGVTWEPPVKATDDTIFDDKPLMAARGDEVLVAYVRPESSRVMAARSLDGGLSFGEPVHVGRGIGPLPLIGPQGRYYVFVWDVLFQKVVYSDDQGATWSEPRQIHFSPLINFLRDPGYKLNTFPSAAVNPRNGDLIVVWNHEVDGDSDILAMRSRDRGETWKGPVRVNDEPPGTAQEVFPWVDYDEDGLAHVVFYDGRQRFNDFDVYYTFSRDGGRTFEPNQRVTAESFQPLLPWESVASPIIGDYIGVAASGGRVYPAYQDSREGNQDVYVARLNTPCDSCLLESRFKVTVEWKNQYAGGREGRGKPIPLTDESVLFTFFSADNVELVVKVLDGRRSNGHFWVFSGALSDVEYWIHVEDRETGEVRTYHNPPGEICGQSDVRAFAALDMGAENPTLAPSPRQKPWDVAQPVWRGEGWGEGSVEVIALRSGSIDTRKAAAVLPGEHDDAYVLVKFPGPVTASQRAALEAVSLRVYTYLPHDTFLVRMPSRLLKAAAKRALGAQWIGPYLPSYKSVPAAFADNDEKRIAVVHVFPDADLDAVAERVEALLPGRVVGRSKGSGSSFSRLRLVAPSRELGRSRDALSRIREVFWIDPEPRRTLLNDSTVEVGQAGPAFGAGTPIFDHGIYGEGQVVGVLDTGLDADHCYFDDPLAGLPATNACDGGTAVGDHRKILAVDFLDPAECAGGISATEWDHHGHGTHVAGTLTGDKGTPLVHDPGDGVAPGARLVVQDGGFGTDDCADLPGLGCPVTDLKPIYEQAYAQGVRIHSSSWGDQENAGVLNVYTTGSQDVDEVMWRHPDLLLLFGAGNRGLDPGSVGSPATAKNVLGVGATQRGRLAERMALFSGCGPSDDGRVKPDVTLPGQAVFSARSNFDVGDPSCSLVGQSGTSMATPAVAGLAALVRQYFTDGFYPSGTATAGDGFVPSAALLKASIINAGQNMAEAPSPIPGGCQGWGRVQLDQLLDFGDGERRLWVHDDRSGFAPGAAALGAAGEERTFTFEVGAAEPLKATLVWTDHPSTPAAAVHLVNDLDLVVMGPDGAWLGNVFDGGVSVAGDKADRRNNVEQVLVSSPVAGTYTVTVRAANVPEGPQPFALVLNGDVEAVEVEPCLECLLDSRFSVSVRWRNQRDGKEGEGVPIAFSDESVLFYFFKKTNVELIVKVLDGRGVNDHFWVFYGALTDLEYWVTVTDTATGKSRTYHNPPGEICGGADTEAF